MSKAGVKFSEVKEILMKDKEFKEEYEKLKLREELQAVEQDRLAGCLGCTPEELDKYLDGIIDGMEYRKNGNEKSFQEEARKILALRFFKERKLSLGKAAELAGMDKDDFVIFLGKNQIDIYQYSERELEQEFDAIDKFVEDLKNEGSN